MTYTSAKPYFAGTGRRKSSIARVRLTPGSPLADRDGRSPSRHVTISTVEK